MARRDDDEARGMRGRVIRGRVMRAGGAGGGGDGFPNATTAGFRSITQTFTGIFNTTADNQTVANMHIIGPLVIRHNNITVRDCWIECNDIFAISTSPDGTLAPALIDHCTIQGRGGNAGQQNNSGIATFFTGTQEIRFCDISGYENGIFVGGSFNAHDNYIHDLDNAISGDPHVDGIQSSVVSGLTIVHNTIISWNTSCIIANGPTAGAFGNITISNNKLLGRPGPPGLPYGINIESLTNSAVTNVTITNNRISNILFFPINIGLTVSGLICTGNTDYVTGSPISPTIETTPN